MTEQDKAVTDDAAAVIGEQTPVTIANTADICLVATAKGYRVKRTAAQLKVLLKALDILDPIADHATDGTSQPAMDAETWLRELLRQYEILPGKPLDD